MVQAQLKCHFLGVTFLDWLILEVGLLHQSPTVIPQWQLVAEACGLFMDLFTISSATSRCPLGMRVIGLQEPLAVRLPAPQILR